MRNRIELDFGGFVLEAAFFDTAISQEFAENLPYQVSLTHWGNELYGSIGIDLGDEDPVEDIPPGGIAYTNQGNYVCVFFGQRPAWAVEYIGQIIDVQWEKLIENSAQTSLEIRFK